MLTQSTNSHQANLFGIDLLLHLDPADPLTVIPWHNFEEAFAIHYNT